MRLARITFVALVAGLLGAGCGDDGGGGGDADAANGGDPDAVAAMTIPDPGTGPANWDAPDNCCGTPATAHAVGVVTVDNPYVEGTADAATGDVFYVFRTGPAFTTLNMRLFDAGATITEVHVHDGSDGTFGAEITPTVSTADSGTWTLTADTTYVFQVVTAAGGFF